MNNHINLKVTHRFLWRLYGYRAVVAMLSGIGILFFPDFFAGATGYSVITGTLPLEIIGILWVTCGVLILGALFHWPYKLARAGMAISIMLYSLWGTGILTNQIINTQKPDLLFAVLAYYSLALTSYFMLLEPPINPETAIKNKKTKGK